MDNGSNQSAKSNATWPTRQAYIMAVVCLLVGLPVGYLLRGSAPTAPAPPVTATSAQASPPAGMTGGMGQQQMPTMEQMKHMADKQAEPLLTKLKSNPNDADLLYQVGNMYTDTHQFKDAIAYYQKSLEIAPKNVKARANMASCLYYTGDVDGALAELDKALTYDPKHAGTLMNIGIMKWKGKNDIDGAIAAWEKLLKLNPNFEQKAVVQHMITEAKQQQAKSKLTPPQKG
jgi:cytochrome c-type biogenesis protein CcmH/NrfG